MTIKFSEDKDSYYRGYVAGRKAEREEHDCKVEIDIQRETKDAYKEGFDAGKKSHEHDEHMCQECLDFWNEAQKQARAAAFEEVRKIVVMQDHTKVGKWILKHIEKLQAAGGGKK